LSYLALRIAYFVLFKYRSYNIFKLLNFRFGIYLALITGKFIERLQGKSSGDAQMAHRISPLWWPVLAAGSPVLIPWLMARNQGFKRDQALAQNANQERIQQAKPLALPEMDSLELTPLVEWEHAPGFEREPGVSYWLKSDGGNVLYDIGFGPERGGLEHNSKKLGFSLADTPTVVISHLHMDHMGGEKAQKTRTVCFPQTMGDTSGITCFVPDETNNTDVSTYLVREPMVLPNGMGTTGPLARRLFLMGWCEEQAMLINIKGKGLVVISGCTHPGIQTVIEMAQKLSPEPIHAIVGGMHFPLSESRLKKPGFEPIMIFGTGKPPWQRITRDDLNQAIDAINQAGPKRVLLSAHDTCDQGLAIMQKELNAKTEVLKAGETYYF
jgi:7,8-dihydropterin-6-yl-methyl-4-(beta-D-ribofuranosyl)aminobenzene 5'-phosphate synthase